MFRKYILFGFIFTLFSILSCKQDQPVHHDDPYFEDYVSPENKWGFINKTGKLVVPAKYDAVSKFSDGLAAVNYLGEWGYIDSKGDVLIPFQYKAAYPFSEDLAKVLSFEGQYFFIHKNGDTVQTIDLIEAGDFSNGMAKVMMANLWGYIDHSGTLLIDPTFERAWNFDLGFAKVMKYGKYGTIDLKGNIVVPIEYDRVQNISDSLFLVKNSKGYFYLDIHGNKKLGPFEKASSFQMKTAFVQNDSQVMLIDKNGIPIETNLDYDMPRYLEKGRYMAKKDGKFGLLDSQGQKLTEFEFQQFNAFHEGIAAYMQDELWGFINIEGEKLCKPVFGLAWDFHDGLARAAFRDGIAYVDKMLQPPFYPEFLDIQDFTEGLAAVQVPD